MSSRLAVEVHDLRKRYDERGQQALAGISFGVEEGEIFGYLGRNGAGKSTTVRILTTLLRPTAGRALVGGFDVCSTPGAVRRVVGAALQEAALDDLMTGREHLVLAGRFAGLGKIGSLRRADDLLEVFGLGGPADRIVATYSGGMRRRLDVAMAMVRRPDVLFLDEPTTGLDAQGRRAVWGLIRELRDSGSTVFLTTQNMVEADELAVRVAIVHEGRIAAIGGAEDLKTRFGGAITIRVWADPTNAARVCEGFNRQLVGQSRDGWLTLRVDGGEEAVPSMIAGLGATGASIKRLRVLAPSLEDVFMNLTGTQIESSTGSDDAASLAAARRGLGVAPGSRR